MPPVSDVFVLCYSVVNPSSLTNIERVWLKRIARYRYTYVKQLLIYKVGVCAASRIEFLQNVYNCVLLEE